MVLNAGVFSLPRMADLSVIVVSSLVVLLSSSTRVSVPSFLPLNTELLGLPATSEVSAGAVFSLVAVVLPSVSTRASDISSLAFSPLVGALSDTNVLFDIGILSMFLPLLVAGRGCVPAVGVISDMLDKTVLGPGWLLDVSGKTVLSPSWPLSVVTSSLISADLPSFTLAINWASWHPVFGSIFVAASLTRAPSVIGVSGAERDWVGFVLEDIVEAGSCFSDFMLSCAFWGVLFITVLRSVCLNSCGGLFIGLFEGGAGVLSGVVDSGVLGGGGVSSEGGGKCVAFVNVLGLDTGGAATAVTANNILSIVNKLAFIRQNP